MGNEEFLKIYKEKVTECTNQAVLPIGISYTGFRAVMLRLCLSAVM